MNILFLSEVFYPHGSGAEYSTYLYATLLSKKGINVRVITNRFAGEPAISMENSVQIYRLPLFKNLKSVKYSTIKRLDVLASSFFNKMIDWANVVYVPRFWFTAIAFAKAHGKPVVVHMHDYISVCSLSSIFNETEEKVCNNHGTICSYKCVYSFEKAHGRNLGQTLASTLLNSTVGNYLPKLSLLADAIICVSTKQRDLIVEREKSFRNKSHVVYNPFPLYRDLEIIGDDFGYFGGPDVLKGFNVLYKAATQINKKTPLSINIHCTKFETTNQQFHQQMSKMGFSLYNRLTVHYLEKLYYRLKSILVPSIWNEPWPYVIVEALVRGRFIIASRIGGIPEQLEGCKGAILCEPGDSEALAVSIKYVNGLSKDEIVDLGFKNRETFLSRFNNESSIKRFISLCDNLT